MVVAAATAIARRKIANDPVVVESEGSEANADTPAENGIGTGDDNDDVAGL